MYFWKNMNPTQSHPSTHFISFYFWLGNGERNITKPGKNDLWSMLGTREAVYTTEVFSGRTSLCVSGVYFQE